MKTTKLTIALSAVLVGTAMLSGSAFAARKVCDDGSYPPCNGGGGEETLSNNVSRPTIVFTGGGLTNVTCASEAWSPLVPPAEPPDVLDGFSIDPALTWFVQGVHTWQAPCKSTSTTPLPVTGAWGDNLTGDAKLKVGSPIRVELVLSEDVTEATVPGFEVLKLQPDLLDRESKYGTRAYTDDSGTTYYATPINFIPGVYDHAGRLRIEQVGGTWVYDQPTGAEINAKGIVVYGYNLRVPTAGDYLITYNLPNVDFNGADAGDCGLPGDAVVTNTCKLLITVGGGGGGGGGGKGKPTK